MRRRLWVEHRPARSGAGLQRSSAEGLVKNGNGMLRDGTGTRVFEVIYLLGLKVKK